MGTATPAGDGTYASSTSFSPSATGDYWWYASSPSDANNNATATACPPAAETVVSLLVHNGATLTDAATDAGSGVASVSYYYCPSPNFTVLTCTSSSPWTFVGASSNTSPYPVTWAGQPTNGDYVVVAVGTDNVMNTDTTPSGSIPVTVSNFAPSVAVTYPTSTTYAGNWSGTITGSASSNDGPGTTITSTAVQIEDTTTSQYWNGSGWQSGAVFNAASGGTSWSYGLSAANLTSGHSYSVTGRAVDSVGNSGTSSTVNFTFYVAPAITTSAATNVSTTTATANGSVNPQGDTDTVQFCYSATVSAVTSSSCGGTLVAASTSPASGSSAVSESAALSGLTPGTKYYYDLVVTSSGGTVYYGATVQNFTVHAAPTVTTGAASSVSTTTATLNGTVNAQSDTDTVSFCYSTIQSQVTTCGAGSTVVVASPATASGSSSTSETAALTGLTAGTTYYYNLEAISSGGTAYFGTSTSLTTIAASGAGTMTVSPTSVTSGSTTNQLVFSFTNNSAGAFASNSEITVQVPSGWTAPTSTNTTVSGGTGCTAGSPTFSGLGPWTITVPLASGCGAGDGFSLNYGITGHTVTVPSSTIGTAVFTTDTEEAGGSLVAVGSSPSVTLTTSFATCGTSTVTLLPNSTVNYTLVGGGGGSGANNSGSGGAGAAVTGTLDNTSASSSVTLSVNVGCVGGNGGTSGGSPGGTAYANGGSGGNGNGGSNRGGGAGGGTTSIQITSGTPAYIVVAGGGGGGGGGSAGANGSTSTSTSSSVTTNAGNAGINGSGSNGYGGGGGGGGTGTLDGAGGAAGNNGSTPAGGGGGGDSYSAGTITDGVTVTAGTPTAGSNPGASGSASL
ncbi:MAG: hypothetical protein WAL61_18375 [Acidimicrobiales bacterium]